MSNRPTLPIPTFPLSRTVWTLDHAIIIITNNKDWLSPFPSPGGGGGFGDELHGHGGARALAVVMPFAPTSVGAGSTWAWGIAAARPGVSSPSFSVSSSIGMPASVGSPLGERVGSSSGERIPPAGAAPVSAVFSPVTVLRMNMVLILMGSVPERFGKESDLFYRSGCRATSNIISCRYREVESIGLTSANTNGRLSVKSNSDNEPWYMKRELLRPTGNKAICCIFATRSQEPYSSVVQEAPMIIRVRGLYNSTYVQKQDA